MTFLILLRTFFIGYDQSFSVHVIWPSRTSMYSIALQQALALLAQEHLSIFVTLSVLFSSCSPRKLKSRIASNILSEHIHHL